MSFLLQHGYVVVSNDCPADHKAYVMDRARGTPQRQQNMPHATSPASPLAAVDVVGNSKPVGSAPLPVPLQQKTKDRGHLSTAPCRSPVRMRQPVKTESPRSRRSSESSSNVDVGSMTPPNVTFALGTPPSTGALKGGFDLHCIPVVSLSCLVKLSSHEVFRSD